MSKSSKPIRAVRWSSRARSYRVIFDAWGEREWVSGFFLWDWPAELYAPDAAEDNDDYCPYGKPAGEFLRSHYRALTTAATGGGR
ncbi:hypothetical protein Q9S36_06350 [Microbacterium sp. ARD31]|uniref:glycoside hydrolase family 113 n=1 Tax=Microbacterium sp. ARD31 TaxID=2962576 RepID=UPI002880D479|nr:hypothetical protein [Microbacterium sp. ARD31]MDT0179832.1 hypothetical protein [Microbacterium sp. ARD31]